ncbi:hypothetical protein MYIN104542_29010 [Mycobacterium intermedium]
MNSTERLGRLMLNSPVLIFGVINTPVLIFPIVS